MKTLSAEERRALQEKRNADLQAQIEAEKAEIEQVRKDAPGYVIGQIERDLKVYQEQAKRLRGHAFERNEVYLSALWKARAALQKAFDRECEPMESEYDTCGPCRDDNHVRCYDPCLCKERGHAPKDR